MGPSVSLAFHLRGALLLLDISTVLGVPHIVSPARVSRSAGRGREPVLEGLGCHLLPGSGHLLHYLRLNKTEGKVGAELL